MNRKFFAVAALATLAALPLAAETYSVDPGHSEVGFTVRHLVSNVRGRFNDFSGKVNMDSKNLPASSVEFHIKTTSIDTAVPDRDKHLRTADFFDVEKYPEISFKSDSIKATGKDKYDVTGTLTMHGVSKKVTLPVSFLGQAKDPWGGTRAGFETSTTLNRKDYGIVWNKAVDNGGVLLGDDVKVDINIEAKVDAPAAEKKGK
ncbi:MAG TPA: YceI family protein [Thermoanaerobaculia bacterium]|jgi:polyisoprenoid-binding protein YceI|nr:YceI family protein [Thermoanaerobaculia bacterium]